MSILKSIEDRLSKGDFEKFINPQPPQSICVVCEERCPDTGLNMNYSTRKPICHNCFDDLNRCVSCGRKRMGMNDDNVCKNCITNTRCILGYSEKPNSLFHRVHKGQCIISERDKGYRHFGVEIETDGYNYLYGNKLASMIGLLGKGLTNNEELLYVKSDSTCDNEIVSHPFTWKYFNKYGYKVFQTLFKMLRRDSFRSHKASDSGMHVHVSRNSIKPTTLYKVLSLVYNEDYYKLILDISQRRESALEEWAKPKLGGYLLENVKRPFSFLSDDTNYREIREYLDRSSAINLHPRHTIEFRLFRGTLNYNSFLKNMDFVRSVLHWGDVTSLKEATEIGRLSYLRFLKKHQSSYLNLCFFLHKKGYPMFTKSQNMMTKKHMTNLVNLEYNSDNLEVL